MDCYAGMCFQRGKFRTPSGIVSARSNDVDIVTSIGERFGHLGQNLGGGTMIGPCEAIDKNDLSLPGFSGRVHHWSIRLLEMNLTGMTDRLRHEIGDISWVSERGLRGHSDGVLTPTG